MNNFCATQQLPATHPGKGSEPGVEPGAASQKTENPGLILIGIGKQ